MRWLTTAPGLTLVRAKVLSCFVRKIMSSARRLVQEDNSKGDDNREMELLPLIPSVSGSLALILLQPQIQLRWVRL